MQKSLAFTIALCLGLASCQVFEKSPTWETVMSVRHDDSVRDPDPSAAYAEKLHRVLLDQGIEHLVVVYQYHYHSNHYDEAVGTRTAIVYRDNVNSSYPWWLMDDRTATPFWLPNGDVDQQVSFYARRPAEILEKHVYPAGGRSGKNAVTMSRPSVVHERTAVVQKPAPVTHMAQVKPVPAQKPAPVTRITPERPLFAAPTTRPAPVTHIQQPAPIAAFKPSAPVARTSPPADSPWSVPTAIEPSDSTPRDARLEKLFHLRHGSSYDPSSTVDRRKMEQLRHGLQERETISERGISPGVDGEESHLR